jgi:PEP-CTERM motif
MLNMRRQIIFLALLIFPLIVAADAKADPLTFSNVFAVQSLPDPTQIIKIDLFRNPGATLTNGTNVSFFIDLTGNLAPGSTDILRLTFVQAGSPTVVKDISIPVVGTIYPPFTLITGLDFPTYYHPVPIEMTIDLLGSSPDFVIPGGPNAGQRVNSFTYTFNVVQPVPEPTTLILLGTGVAGLVAGSRKRRRADGRDKT